MTYLHIINVITDQMYVLIQSVETAITLTGSFFDLKKKSMISEHFFLAVGQNNF